MGVASWIGMRSLGAPYTFSWDTTGEDAVFTRWKGGFAYAECGYLEPNGEWNRAACGDQNVKRGSVCERRPAGWP